VLLDVRYQIVSSKTPIFNYRMPSSMFLFSYNGSAEVCLDDNVFSVERFGIFHGGKGSCLSIRPNEGEVNFYTIYYKTEEPPFYKEELIQLLSVVNPFQELYGFSPRNPLLFLEQLKKLHHRWNGGSLLNSLYGRAALLQWVCAIYEELTHSGTQELQPDTVSLVKLYLDEHYHEMISLQDLAERFHISSGHLTRLFKKQLQVGPQEYVIRRRVEAARRQLLDTDATLREIAWSCGFSDEFHLIKMFKSCYGVTPGDFRKMSSIRLSDAAMGKVAHFPYASRELAGLDLITKGEYTVIGANKGNFILSAALCLMLLLSACSAPAPSTGGANAANSVPTQGADSQQAIAATREFQQDGQSTVVPAEPQRIIADWFYGELLALGIRPIGYPDYLLKEYPFADPDGTVGLGESIEQIIELKPDLIISTWAESYEQFSKIAPSVLLESKDGVINKMQVLGELVNKQEEAENWIRSFKQKLETSRQRLAKDIAPGTTVTILGVFKKDLRLYGFHNMGGEVLYNLLQIEPPQRVKEMFEQSDAWNQSISFEMLEEIAGTHIILTVYDPENSGRETIEQLEQSELWKNLDAVKNGRVHKIDYYDLFFDDPIAIEHQIEMLTNLILQ